jgi:cellulase
MDIWEANEYVTALTLHTCNETGLYECSGEECSRNGICDQWGCSWNPYTLGNEHFYGLKRTVDATRKVTVVTQFPTFTNGTPKEIRHLMFKIGRYSRTPPLCDGIARRQLYRCRLLRHFSLAIFATWQQCRYR